MLNIILIFYSLDSEYVNKFNRWLIIVLRIRSKHPFLIGVFMVVADGSQ